MQRLAHQYLSTWLGRKTRKPLIIRGARQVGKTYAVRELAKQKKLTLIEVNLDLEKNLAPLFDLEPEKLLQELAVLRGEKISAHNSLLFLDEIQAVPQAIAALRYFHEKMPEFPVIAAGSLLDFALKDFKHSMPVGRVEFYHMYPLSFGEFLLAAEGAEIFEHLGKINLSSKISVPIHDKLLEILRRYFFIGGMPEAVATYLSTKDLMEVRRVQASILQTFESDFAKYGTKAQQDLLKRAFKAVPALIGEKIKYVKINSEQRSKDVKVALELLTLARVIKPVFHTSGNRIPLEAEKNENRFKLIFLDIGLAHNALGLKLSNLGDWNTQTKLASNLLGAMAEQFVGQELLASGDSFEESALYYWHRESKNSNAEVDYLMAQDAKIFPVEVKAGLGTTLRSLQQFLLDKNGSVGVRLSTNALSVEQLELNGGGKYKLYNLPLYLAGALDRIELLA